MEKVKVIFFVLMSALIIMTVTSWKEEQEALIRLEQEEEQIAAFLEQAETEQGRKTQSQKEEQEESEEKGWSDDVWFQRDGITYTPEYAKGTLDAVLEIESIQLRRGVYIGTEEEILHDLDMWMLTAARPDYRLGETHYCIYGHNCTGSGQEISMNRLQQVKIGDYFTLTTQSQVYVYEITAVYGMGREEATRKLVDDFSLPAENCYLITCGRGEYRYLDFVVEGHLVDG